MSALPDMAPSSLESLLPACTCLDSISAQAPNCPDAQRFPGLWHAVPEPGFTWNPVTSTAVRCLMGSFCPGLSRSAVPQRCGANLTSHPGAWSQQQCGPLPGFYGVPPQLAPANTYALGFDPAAQPIPCPANMQSPAGSSSKIDCGESAA